jgi:hypothetical protein
MLWVICPMEIFLVSRFNREENLKFLPQSLALRLKKTTISSKTFIYRLPRSKIDVLKTFRRNEAKLALLCFNSQTQSIVSRRTYYGVDQFLEKSFGECWNACSKRNHHSWFLHGRSCFVRQIALIQKVPTKVDSPQNINNYDKTIYDVQKKHLSTNSRFKKLS